MKRTWKVSRSLKPQSDGQRRWDIAYQLLWQWTLEQEAQVQPTVADKQEKSNEDRTVYVRVSTGRQQQNQTIEQQLDVYKRR